MHVWEMVGAMEGSRVGSRVGAKVTVQEVVLVLESEDTNPSWHSQVYARLPFASDGVASTQYVVLASQLSVPAAQFATVGIWVGI
jgi:hypothetical protein